MTDLRVATLNLLNFAAPPLACYEWDNIYTEAQWQQKTNWLKNLLQQQQQWLAQPLLIRELSIPYDSTACAVDHMAGALYIAEADRAIWRYQAEPEADEGRSLVQVNKPFGQLQGEVKALQTLPDGSLLALEDRPHDALRAGIARRDAGDRRARWCRRCVHGPMQ